MLEVKITDPWLEEHLSAEAAKRHQSPQEFLQAVIAEHLEDLEDVAECDRRMADIRSGKTKTISLSEMERRLGLAH